MSETPITKTEIDPSISWNAKLGMSALRAHLNALASVVASGGADDESIADLTFASIWLAEKVACDIDAAHQNADEASSCIQMAIV